MKIKTNVVAILMAAALMGMGTAYAVPALQLYMPGSTYDPGSESHVISHIPFALQVLGASKNGNINRINSPYLHIAVPQGSWEDGTTVTLTGPGHESGVTISAWSFGQPAALSPHGIYPTHYASLLLPDMDVGNGTDIIKDYIPGGTGQDTGVIYEYEVSYTGAAGLHMDASGIALMKNDRTQPVFAPYSHDADSDNHAPEPASMLVVAAGVAGLAARRKRS